ncbi:MULTISPECIES: aldehyde dehydrogenase family protein [unclassified Mycolicibacterium]|uniref:aldehyde dehydrogenase family protein n=1 Tax=unclassified Mycolicibacterium TaxID=2636767 RepID=UPI0012DF3B07|nr:MULTISPECIES: aldehyde dehydrogenase family protein [unclassified Mycolicibacterium]MUL81640.1 aldehyde dehydrogenase family protein [Mycolicibacterium sp. CBMA 329]MUL87406.1 aldehyde dehydrogenase family protein [Mycolicibacterium sp. CBMA 331]MUL99728.1 aldehyde dehydrogenase family protein [Mycolicibacterium sp. CBMA 334]MUM25361.1 aldehyde dehydrogenase family protein [Mycolicibacterium sp. CBMA 295]MUM37703.1 aldehyde dehydrogenase family protein [Mycolicibacterium sp. CBMA 247]
MDKALQVDGTAIVDPCTGEIFEHQPDSTKPEIDAAFATARDAWRSWRDTTPGERQAALLRFADAIESQSDQLVAIEQRNTGKSREQVLDELAGALDEMRFMAGAQRALQGPMAGRYVSGTASMSSREALGVCAQILPWNYPLASAISKLAPALAMGNTSVLKPAAPTPCSVRALVGIAAETLPAGVVNAVFGGREAGEYMVAHHVPALISLTGSVRAGREIARAAGLKVLHLELGGNCPVIVLEDVDVEATAREIAEAALYNAGQDCTAATRLLVATEVVDEFVTALTREFRAAQTVPLATPEHLDRVTGLLARLPNSARVECGGRRAELPGLYVEPTVVTGVAQGDEIVGEEIFGPVVTVQPFASVDEAVALANGTEYGLAASIWTRDHSSAVSLSGRVDAGTVWINTHGLYATEMPFGGFKSSGYGKDLSSVALENYSRLKHIMTGSIR